MASQSIRQRRIVTTVTNQTQLARIVKLLKFEPHLVQLLENISVENCLKMRDLLKEIKDMNLSRFEWQKNLSLASAVCLTLLDFGKKEVAEEFVDGKLPDLVIRLKKLRKVARDTKRQCLDTFKCTMATHGAFKTALFRYQVAQSFPVHLFNLADEATCNEIARIYNKSFQLSSNKRVVFDYTQNWSLNQFITFTNIRELVVREISATADKDKLESELAIQDHYIEFIYDNFLKLPEAWYWTLLSEIHCTNEMFNSEWLLRLHGIQSCNVKLQRLEQDKRDSFISLSRELALQLSNYYTTLLERHARLIPHFISKNSNPNYHQFLVEVKQHNTVSTQTDPVADIVCGSASLRVEQISNVEPITSQEALQQNDPCLNGDKDTVLAEMTDMFRTDDSDISTPHSVIVAERTESERITSSKESHTGSGGCMSISTPQTEGLTLTPDSPFPCYQKPNQILDQSSEMKCVVKVEASSQSNLDYGSDVEIIEAPPEQIHTVLDFDSTQDLIACLQTPGNVLTPPIVVNARENDVLVTQHMTQGAMVLSSQEFGSASTTSEEPPSAVSQTQQAIVANVKSQQLPNERTIPTLPFNQPKPNQLLPRVPTLLAKRTFQTSPKRMAQSHTIPEKKRHTKSSQLDRTQVPRHIFQPLSFGQSTKAANTATTKTMNIIVPDNVVVAMETESSENGNSWDFETQPVICELSDKIPKRKSGSQLLPVQSDDDEVSLWNSVLDPTSFAWTYRQMLNSGSFDFVNQSTELNFSVALRSSEHETVLNSDMFFALMNVAPPEQLLLSEIINSASRSVTYGLVHATAIDEALCFLLFSADPANEYSTDYRTKFIHKVHNFLNSQAEILNICRQSRSISEQK